MHLSQDSFRPTIIYYSFRLYKLIDGFTDYFVVIGYIIGTLCVVHYFVAYID